MNSNNGDRDRFLPSVLDIAWATFMVSIVADGALVAFPGTRLIYRVNHTVKTFTMTNPEVLKDSESLEVHNRTKKVFAEIGYKVS